MAGKGETIVECVDISKNFGVTRALKNVDLRFRRGEICGLIGENGSGKSTVSSIISGMQTQSSGEMKYRGENWNPANSLHAAANGIAMIVQEAGTIANISVAENIFLGNYAPFKIGPFISRKKMNIAAKEAMSRVGISEFQPGVSTSFYDMQERKLIEIVRAAHSDPEVLIVDETTTALSQNGRKLLYSLMHRLADENKSVVFISHDLEELMEHCDTLTVLRDGELIATFDKDEFDEDKIKQSMIGREMKGQYYRNDLDGYEDRVVLKADCVTTMTDLLCFDLELHKGEILGVGGLSDCGMHALGRALYGLEDVVDGFVLLPQKGVRIDNARTAMNNKMGYISKNRDSESLELNASIGANIQSTGYRKNRSFGPFVSGKKEKDYTMLQVDTLAIKCVDVYQPVRALSGGNKQKVVFGKWIAHDPEILIMDCPTRGVDVGVKAEMYRLILEMKRKGKSIVLISEEMEELVGMSDRLVIMKDGKITGEFLRPDGYDSRAILECMI